MYSHPKRPRRRGLTLIEVVITITLTVIISGILLGILINE